MTTQQVDIVNRSNFKELGQARPADTTAVSLYSPGSNISAEVISIYVSNTTGSAATFRIFVDVNGTTFDETTALFFDTSLAANTTLLIEGRIYLNNTLANIAVRQGTASALTFTAYGSEQT